MRNMIEEFYFGNIVPNEPDVSQPANLQKAMEETAEAEEFLNARLEGESLAALKRLVKAQMEVNSISTLDHYVRGFKNGARFMLAILDEESGNARSQ
ncbi:hypothetical protein MKD04_05835 [[Clostridium] innocuum]|nr:hypothetical protein [[Clostridium] innocuum]MCR0502940.1 hypothetical protein [[Clostridium] innocuum]